jgi:hypothetical protein
MKIIKTIITTVLVSCMMLNVGCSNDKSKEKTYEKAAEEAIMGYLSALQAHNVPEIEKYVHEDWKKKYLSDEDYITAFVETVESCENVRVDVEHIKQTGENEIEVPVKYILTYADEYMPVGTLDVGKNEMDDIFTLEEQENGQYVLTHIRSSNIQ